MARQVLNPNSAAPNDKLGDTPWDYTGKLNSMTEELYGFNKESNIVEITEEADFPTQDGTTITIESGTGYFIKKPFTTAKRFIMEGGQIFSVVTNIAYITYTGTGVMFTATQNRVRIDNLVIACPNATVLEVIGDGTKVIDYRANVSNFVVLSCIGVFNSVNGGVLVASVCNFIGTFATSAILLTGTGSALQSLDKVSITGLGVGAKGFDMGTTTNAEIELINYRAFGDSSASAIAGLTNSGNIDAGGLMTVEGGNFSAFTNPLLGVSTDDTRLSFDGNAGVPDTQPDALTSFIGNATETIISASSTDGSNAVLIAGAWVEVQSSLFSTTAAGRITYLAERPLKGPIDISLGLISSGGGAITVKFYLFKNGVVIPASGLDTAISGSVASNISQHWQLTFEENDYIEIFIENQTNTTNIIVDHAVFRVL